MTVEDEDVQPVKSHSANYLYNQKNELNYNSQRSNKTRVAQLFSHKVPRIFIILTQDVIILAFLNHPLRHIIRRASTTENIHSSKYKIPPSRCSIHIEQVSLEERREKEKRK